MNGNGVRKPHRSAGLVLRAFLLVLAVVPLACDDDRDVQVLDEEQLRGSWVFSSAECDGEPRVLLGYVNTLSYADGVWTETRVAGECTVVKSAPYRVKGDQVLLDEVETACAPDPCVFTYILRTGEEDRLVERSCPGDFLAESTVDASVTIEEEVLRMRGTTRGSTCVVTYRRQGE